MKKHCPKHNFTSRDLTRILLTLWTQDDLIFIPERYRVQTTFIIHVYCWTGARISAFFTDGLRYKVRYDRKSAPLLVVELIIPGRCARAATHERPKLETHLQGRLAVGQEQP